MWTAANVMVMCWTIRSNGFLQEKARLATGHYEADVEALLIFNLGTRGRMSGLSRNPVVRRQASEGQKLANERTRFAGEVAREVAGSAGGGRDRLNGLG
jgi:hypothetical protein